MLSHIATDISAREEQLSNYLLAMRQYTFPCVSKPDAKDPHAPHTPCKRSTHSNLTRLCAPRASSPLRTSIARACCLLSWLSGLHIPLAQPKHTEASMRCQTLDMPSWSASSAVPGRAVRFQAAICRQDARRLQNTLLSFHWVPTLGTMPQACSHTTLDRKCTSTLATAARTFLGQAH